MKVYIIAEYYPYEGYRLWQSNIAYTDIEKARAKVESFAAGMPDYYKPWRWDKARTEYRGARSMSYEIFEMDVN